MSKINNFSINRRAALAAGLVAALGVGGAVATAQAADKVVVGALRFTSHSAGFIALEKGYFAEQNLDVSFEFFQAAQPIAVAVAAGDADFGIAGVTGGLMNLAAKDAVKIVAGVLHEKKGIDGMMIMASNKAYEAGLTSPAKLPGHSLAMTQVGSTFHYMTARVAEKEGFALSDVKLVPLQKVGSMIGALKSGQVDSMIMVPHIAKALTKAGAAKEIGWLYNYAEYQISTLFTSTANTKERRDIVARFVKAYGKGIADFNRVMVRKEGSAAELEEMTKTIHKYVYVDRPYEKAAPPIQAGAMNLNEGAALHLTDVTRQMIWFQKQNLVPQSLSIEQLVDASFVKTY
ncbi:MAG: ABC transporter substrate-binding protein [Alphaproteobacteria bacterium]